MLMASPSPSVRCRQGSPREDYLKAYADPVGELINSYIPHGTHGDMDRYLYDPLRNARKAIQLGILRHEAHLLVEFLHKIPRRNTAEFAELVERERDVTVTKNGCEVFHCLSEEQYRAMQDEVKDGCNPASDG